MRSRRVRFLIALFMAALAGPHLRAQDSSSALAPSLTRALQAHHLEAFAAPIPGTQDEFAAALLYPGVQLLVVSARYPQPAIVQAQLAAGNYRDVYQSLQNNPIPDSKLFVQDMGADGLRVQDKQTPDVIYQQVVHQTVFTGDVRGGAYRKQLALLDPAYSRALQVLVGAIDALQAPASGGDTRR